MARGTAGVLGALCVLVLTAVPLAGAQGCSDSDIAALEAATAGVNVPVRSGPAIVTTGSVPHEQVNAPTEVPAISEELLARMGAVPGLDIRDTQIGAGGSEAFWIDEGQPLLHGDVIVVGREFGHQHPDGSLHVTLSPELSALAICRGWGEKHPWTDSRGWDGFLMIFTPYDQEQLDVTYNMLIAGYNYVTVGDIHGVDGSTPDTTPRPEQEAASPEETDAAEKVEGAGTVVTEMTFQGLMVTDFDDTLKDAFAATVAAEMDVAADAVTITDVKWSEETRRRARVLLATGVVVQFEVQVESASEAVSAVAALGEATESGDFITAFQAAEGADKIKTLNLEVEVAEASYVDESGTTVAVDDIPEDSAAPSFALWVSAAAAAALMLAQ